MTDGISDLIVLGLGDSPPLSDDPHVVDRFHLFGKSLSSGEYKDMKFVFEDVQLIWSQYLEEADALMKNVEQLSFLGLQRFLLFVLPFGWGCHY